MGILNKEYQVLVWEKYEHEFQLGVPQIEEDFDTYEEAFEYYIKVDKFLCKMIMQYKTNEDDSDGDILKEHWKYE